MGLAASAGSVAGAAEIHGGCTLAWASMYELEGRDTLGEGGIFSGTVEASWLGLDLLGWYGHGDNVNYREINLAVARAWTLGPVEVSVSYMRLQFDADGARWGDNEVGGGVMGHVGGGVECLIGGRYSTRAKGSFLELAVQRPIETGWGGLVIVPHAMQGFDFGYASPDHDGANHFEVGLAFECPLGRACRCFASVTHCFAQRDVELDGLGDVTFASVGAGYAF